MFFCKENVKGLFLMEIKLLFSVIPILTIQSIFLMPNFSGETFHTRISMKLNDCNRYNRNMLVQSTNRDNVLWDQFFKRKKAAGSFVVVIYNVANLTWTLSAKCLAFFFFQHDNSLYFIILCT